MKKLKRCLAVLLALCMILTCTCMTAFAEDTDVALGSENEASSDVAEASSDVAEASSDETKASSDVTDATEASSDVIGTFSDVKTTSYDSSGGSLDTNSFYKMVLIDCGRGYYSVEDIKSIIDTMSENDYEYLMLGFGNDGLRFVLDDMSVTVGDTIYDSATVKNAVISANDTLQNNSGNGQWTQSQMDAIISYASGKKINIVPMLNCPGHAYSVYQAMAAATGITNAYTAYGTTGTNKYNYSIDLSNETVKGFVEGLVEKYISYFAGKGCKFFNLGCDETKYAVSQTVNYVNDVCATMPTTMVPMAFCDILQSTSGYPSNLVGIDWDGGYLSSNYNMNANDNWYYVLNNSGTWGGYSNALSKVQSIPVTKTIGGETAYGSILAVWNDNYVASSSYIENIQNLITAQAASNKDKFTVLTKKDISVAVGSQATDTLSETYDSFTSEPDSSIATGSIESTTESYTGQSVTLNRNNYSLYSNNGYYYQTADGYYEITSITRNSGYYLYNNSTLLATVASQTAITLYTKSQASGTTVTFNGVSAGTTTAVVGTTQYNITVTPEDVSGKTLTYYPFLSDYPVYKEGTGSGNCGAETKTNPQTLAAAEEGVNTESGVDISTIAWAEGDWLWEGSTVQTVYWKGVLHHNESDKQAGVASDKSLNGTDFTYVRYYNGSWAVSADRENWTTVSDSDEVCVYYLQQTEITKEVTTYVKDWAFTTKSDDVSNWYNSSTAHKALSFSVVYPDGQMSPTADSIYSDSTLIYWYDTGAKSTSPTMMIRVGVNEVYKVSKITWTLGTMTDPSSSSSTDGSLIWNMKTDDDGNEWYDETTYWTPDKSDDPVVKTSDFCGMSQGTYNTSKSALLILIYLEPVETEDSLTVQYWNDNANSEIMNYALNIKNTGTEKGTFCDRLLDKDGNQKNPEAGKEIANLADDDYVLNAADVKETFQKDLTKIPSLAGGMYATGLYTYQKAELSADGKTLILHYNLGSDYDVAAKYVIDFGLPMEIPVSELLPEGSTAVVTEVTSKNGSFGTVTVNGINSLTYTPTQVLDGKDVISVTLKYKDGNSDKRNIEIYPATTVYYEEGFATYSDGWTGSASLGTGTQTRAILGKDGNCYGFDSKYTGEGTGASNTTQATSSAMSQTASFSFTGTGVDIYANSNTLSGRLYIQIKKDGVTKRIAQVSTAMKNGTGSATDDQNVTGYNIPVYTINGLDHGTYDVTISHMANSGSTAVSDINIDGFRVYNTLSDSSVFADDKEDNPNYIELRNAVIKAYNKDASGTYNVYNDDTATDATVAIVSNEADYSAVTVADFLTNGPKNEIYLQPNQTIVFKVTTAREVQIGLKALNGSTDYELNDETKSLSTSTDMFYTVKEKSDSKETQEVTLKNCGTGILAVTKLKVCDDPSATLAPLTDEDIAAAVEVAEAEPQPVSADATLTVDVNGATTVLTKNGVEGEAVTFTAAEIQEAAEALVADGYELKASYQDVATTYGANETVSFTATQKPVNPVQNFFKNFFNRFRNMFGRR